MMYPITQYFIGVDLGRDQDYSAIAVLALRREDQGPYDHARLVQPTRLVLQLGSLKRIPLGVEYVETVRILRQTVTRLQSAAGWGAAPVKIHLAIDSAGPGQVCVELIRAQKLGINLVPMLLTSGHEAGYTHTGKVTVPRRELVSTLRYLLEIQTLRVQSSLKHFETLKREVAAVSPRGGQYEHDDIVIAAALAAWQATRVHTEMIRGTRAA